MVITMVVMIMYTNLTGITKNISYVIEREVDDDQFRFYRDTDVVNVEEGKKGYLNVTYSNGMVTKYPKKEALRWRVIDYIKMR